jgi:L-lactate dehydrogenase
MGNKVVIIGCGNVGMSYAYALMNQKVNVNELVLIDVNREKIEGEAMDLNHCLPYGPSRIVVKAGDYSDVKDAKLIVIAAGANQEVGETRLDLINKNSKIFKSIITEVMANGFNGIFLVATNPVDAMSYLTFKYSKLPQNKVMGSGTSLDTARLRYILGDRLGVNSKNVHAYVIGEHGDSEFVLWSSATLGSEPLKNSISVEDQIKIEDEVRNAAYEIIKKKGAINYGIGMCLVKITNAILNDENTILTVSTYHTAQDVYISTPAIVNASGIKKLTGITVSKEEKVRYDNSLRVIKESIEKV